MDSTDGKAGARIRKADDDRGGGFVEGPAAVFFILSGLPVIRAPALPSVLPFGRERPTRESFSAGCITPLPLSIRVGVRNVSIKAALRVSVPHAACQSVVRFAVAHPR